MLILGMDTAFSYLSLVLIQENKIIDKHYEACFKNQSEIIFDRLKQMFDRNKIKGNSLDAMVITKGPGSFTGLRIAMSIAKVYTSQKNIELYTLSTLQLYAGLTKKIVVMDARANRCYLGIYQGGLAEIADGVWENEEAKRLLEKYPDYSLYGAGEIVDREIDFSDISDNFISLKPFWQRVENIHLLTPVYLKEEVADGFHKKSQ